MFRCAMRSRSHLFVVTGIAGIFLFGLFANTAFQSREATVTTQLAETVSAAATTPAPTSHDANHAWGYDEYDGPVTWQVHDLAVR